MSDTKPHQIELTISQPTQLSSPLTAGKLLAQKRLDLGWTIDQVSQQIKLASRQIKAIEADDYAALPDKATARGFMRTYAKLLKLDTNHINLLLNEDSHSFRDVPLETKFVPSTFTGASMPGSGINRPILFGLILTLLLVFTFLLLSSELIYKPHSTSNNSVLSSQISDEILKLVPTSASQEAQTTNTQVITQEPKSEVKNTASIPTSTAQASFAPPNQVNVSLAKVPTYINTIELRTTAETWVQVKGSGGKVFFNRTLKAGIQQSLNVTPPVQVVVGNVAGLALSWRGVPIDLVENSSHNVAQLTLE